MEGWAKEYSLSLVIWCPAPTNGTKSKQEENAFAVARENGIFPANKAFVGRNTPGFSAITGKQVKWQLSVISLFENISTIRHKMLSCRDVSSKLQHLEWPQKYWSCKDWSVYKSSLNKNLLQPRHIDWSFGSMSKQASIHSGVLASTVLQICTSHGANTPDRRGQYLTINRG